jgi:hypothetical protein
MSLRDKMEVGLKPDAPYRPDNLPDFQLADPACDDAAAPGSGPKARRAREDCETPRRAPRARPKPAARTRVRAAAASRRTAPQKRTARKP